MDHHVPLSIIMGLRIRQVDAVTAYEDGAHDSTIRPCLIGLHSSTVYCSVEMTTWSPRQYGARGKEFRFPV
jgi:hypothetical protein